MNSLVPCSDTTGAGEEDGVAEERGNEFARRPVVDLPAVTDLDDLAGVHQGDAVADEQRLVLVVRDVDDRHAELAVEARELELHVFAESAVEGGQGLVEEQEPRLVDQRAGERDALALAPAQFGDLAVADVRELDEFEHLANSRGDLAP